jgi:hypothetical protein
MDIPLLGCAKRTSIIRISNFLNDHMVSLMSEVEWNI